MKIFLAIQSCHADRKNGRQAASADTYLKSWGAMLEHAYFIGGNGTPDMSPHELAVGCLDDYSHCAWKTRAAADIALRSGMDYMFHCCTDTYVIIPRLLQAVPVGKNYVGNVCDEGQASGGCGYWLSRAAMRIVADAEPKGGYEDLWVGRTLAAKGITPTHDPRYRDGKPNWDDDVISAHLGRTTGGFQPQWMVDCHREYTERLT